MESSRPTTRPRNSFEFVTVASARARQLLEGCVPKIEGSPKPARRALQEVAAGRVTKVEPPSPSA
ncbi:MAG: DNA-directed RNA polymerase subunit omega [Acidobacteria bacterium]|nr:DNA-directed RNA polymerase subunit omega [Acidobacteriota bacterium]